MIDTDMKKRNQTLEGKIDWGDASPKSIQTAKKILSEKNESTILACVIFGFGLLAFLSPIIIRMMDQKHECEARGGSGFWIGILLMGFSTVRMERNRIRKSLTEILIKKVEANHRVDLTR